MDLRQTVGTFLREFPDARPEIARMAYKYLQGEPQLPPDLAIALAVADLAGEMVREASCR